jgi:hypothetical protein
MIARWTAKIDDLQWDIRNKELDTITSDAVRDLATAHALPVSPLRILFHEGALEAVGARAYREFHKLTFRFIRELFLDPEDASRLSIL